MRIWDRMDPRGLCRQHLLGQWREGLGLLSILTNGKTGYANHPETKRWVGFERALYNVLIQTRNAMLDRNYKPKELPRHPVEFLLQRSAFRDMEETWPKQWDDQLAVLRAKDCACEVP